MIWARKEVVMRTRALNLSRIGFGVGTALSAAAFLTLLGARGGFFLAQDMLVALTWTSGLLTAGLGLATGLALFERTDLAWKVGFGFGLFGAQGFVFIGTIGTGVAGILALWAAYKAREHEMLAQIESARSRA
jgi:hypothetical protein